MGPVLVRGGIVSLFAWMGWAHGESSEELLAHCHPEVRSRDKRGTNVGSKLSFFFGTV